MKIAIDLDGVTWDVQKHLLEIYNEKYGTNHKIEDITYWNFLPEDRFWKVYEEMVKRITEYEPVDPKIGGYINLLYLYYNISFLTHGIYTVDIIEKKLKTWSIFKHLSYDSIILEDYTTPKVIHDFDYFIDDNPNLAMEIRVYPKKTLLLFTQPWNRNINVNDFSNVIRVDNWLDIQKYFLKCVNKGDLYEKKV